MKKIILIMSLIIGMTLHHIQNAMILDDPMEVDNPMEALRIAIEDGNGDTVIDAIHAGADFDAVLSNGRMPFEYAVSIGSYDAQTALLEQGLNPDQLLQDGTSILNLAIQQLDKFTVKLLVNAGANVDLPDGNGLTPYNNAQQRFISWMDDDISEAFSQKMLKILAILRPPQE